MDFGMATCTGLLQAPVVEGRELAAGGGTPLYASLAQLEGRSTSPVDDIESLWYCLAFLEQGQLPWQWEPQVCAPSSLPACSGTCACACCLLWDPRASSLLCLPACCSDL